MQDIDILMFTYTDKWKDWEEQGFPQRWAILADKLRLNDKVRRLIVVNVPTSIAGCLINHKGLGIPKPYAFQVEELSPKLSVISHTRILPRERVNSFAFKVNGMIHDRFLISAINNYLASIDCRNPVLWMSGPLTAKYIGHFNEAAVVYDAADDWLVHDMFKPMHGEIEKSYVEICRKADIVFAVSDSLRDLFNKDRSIAHLVPNGVDIKRFSSDDRVIPNDIEGLPHPIIGYVGALQNRIDVDVLQVLLTALPDASFAFVGKMLEAEHFKKILSFPNAHFVGTKSPVEVPSYMSSFDLCIMPHVSSDLTRSMDPMKLYEYLAAGKPVVASELPGLDRMAEIISLAADPEQFLRLVIEGLASDCPAKIQSRISFAQNNSWDARIEYMLSLIDAHLRK
jgi:glycosyltransferase involved in cell wall biosynthesis